MNFKDFILQSPNYKGLYILEENGNEKIIIGKNNQFGNKTDKTIMIYIEKTKTINLQNVYLNNKGYFVLYKRNRIYLDNFKRGRREVYG